MNRPVTELKGVGPARARVLEEIGITLLEDLWYYFPRRYIDRTLTDVDDLETGKVVTLFVRVQSTYQAHGRRSSRLIVHCRTFNGQALSLVWFKGVTYFKKVLERGQSLVVSGKLDFYSGLQMVHPDFEVMDPDDENALIHVGRIIPLYPSTEALKKQHLDSRGFRRLIAQLVDPEKSTIQPEILATVPEELHKRRGLIGRYDALRQIHYPENASALQSARRYLKYEELYLFGVLMVHRARQRAQIPRRVTPLPFAESQEYHNLLKRLDFTLTGDQLNAIETILNDCRGDHAGAFLLQGDVGAGKTLVALSIALHYIEAGLQAAIIAPTEVLARQHFLSISQMLGINPTVHVELITGQKGKKKDRELLLQNIASGEINLLIGTHSMLEAGVHFHKLGLVVIDEQHRFGVEQRETLRGKGENPDTIAMTATPIPRTLCLTEFADLKMVALREKPAGRKPIKTMWLSEEQRAGMYKSIRRHVDQGRQCYIVYPMIAESEKIDLKAAEAAFAELSTAIFPHYRVALLHGRLKAAEKEQVMREFRAGAIQVLVTTSVIEVGVDVPNATIMIIEHAERFGISQLHQLRGRVGRSEAESFCVLMADASTDESRERLQAIVDSQDGFYLAEVDMRLRGPGELLGLKQHGFPGFRMADLIADRELAEAAHQDAREFADINEPARIMIRKRFDQGIVIFPN
ncbi:MAG: ATP-dependent DNA helicase RecG [Leptospiraceae bacterium]|nr:ATP-dependent DNA helicase RecG [Leptospiraceae bacterium]